VIYDALRCSGDERTEIMGARKRPGLAGRLDFIT
jgi:hypothetical protein